MPDLFTPPITMSATMARDGAQRLTLTRAWDDRPKACFIGHNPSTADHRKNDPSVLRSVAFAKAWGYGGVVWVNLYPIRTPDPAAARRWANWEHNGPDYLARDDINRGRDVMAREAKASGIVIACWGAIARDDAYVEAVLEEISSGEAPWPAIHVLGLTAGGAPIHPMARGKHRVPDSARPILWKEGSLECRGCDGGWRRRRADCNACGGTGVTPLLRPRWEPVKSDV